MYVYSYCWFYLIHAIFGPILLKKIYVNNKFHLKAINTIFTQANISV